MGTQLLSRLNLVKQYGLSIGLPLLVSAGCLLLPEFIGYRLVALLLLLCVSVSAMVCSMAPVLVGAVLSALLWDFLFIPPRFTLVINSAEDLLTVLMYFVIALVNAVLTARIRRAEQLAALREEKENTLKLYNTLLNSLSHELKTPIATIIGASDNLHAMADKLSELDKYELTLQISKASWQLNRQVSNLLNMSRLESGFIQPKKDWFDIGELIHDVVGQLSDEAQGKPIHVAIAPRLPLFKLDYGLLAQVVHNLIHNALVYIPKYAVVTVKANCRDTRLVLVVEDSGQGFPENEIERVFDKFYRLKNSATGGTGLGLSIVKGFVEAMDGRIRLENMPDGGARFTIDIPSELSYVQAEQLKL